MNIDPAYGPLLAAAVALVGVLVAQAVLLWQADRSERRWRREESLRMMRWASELAVADDPAGSMLGVVVLGALGDIRLMQAEDNALVSRILEAVMGGADANAPGYADDGAERAPRDGEGEPGESEDAL